MPKYKLYFSKIVHYSCEIEADDEEKAHEMADELEIKEEEAVEEDEWDLYTVEEIEDETEA